MLKNGWFEINNKNKFPTDLNFNYECIQNTLP